MGRGIASPSLVAIAACAVLVGCGGGGGESTGQTTIDKRVFIRRADELCARSYRQSERLKVPPLPPRRPDQLDEAADYFRAEVAIGSRELAQIRRLGDAVPGTAAQTENLDTVDSLLAEMRAVAYHARRGNLGRAGSHYRQVQEISERATELAKQFGYDVCGQGGVHRVLNR